MKCFGKGVSCLTLYFAYEGFMKVLAIISVIAYKDSVINTMGMKILQSYWRLSSMYKRTGQMLLRACMTIECIRADGSLIH